MGLTRVLIIDDHEQVRVALLAKLASDRDLQVTGTAAATATALDAALAFAPDVVLLDVKRTDGSGLQICRKIAQERPETRVLVLTSYPDEQEKADAQALGVGAYLLKDLDLQALIRQIKVPQRRDGCMEGRPAGSPVRVEADQGSTQQSR